MAVARTCLAKLKVGVWVLIVPGFWVDWDRQCYRSEACLTSDVVRLFLSGL